MINDKHGVLFFLEPRVFFVLGIIFFLAIYGGTSASVVDIRTYENTDILDRQTGNFNFAGYQGTYETVYLGDVDCSGNPGTFYCYPSGSGGNVEKSMRLSNSLKDGQTLTLTSTAYADGDDFTNYIETKIILPPGTISGNYQASASFRDTKASNFPSAVVFEVIDEKYSKVIPTRSTSYSFGDSFEIELEEEQEVIFKITTMGGEYIDVSSNGKLTINFEADPNTQQNQEESSTTSTGSMQQNPQTSQSNGEVNFVQKVWQWFKSIFGFN